uniref:Uncharacterized protein n=1 Tax=Tetranychus urticae TaxID=32264 RepID=T1KR23_TETUR
MRIYKKVYRWVEEQELHELLLHGHYKCELLKIKTLVRLHFDGNDFNITFDWNRTLFLDSDDPESFNNERN